MNLNTEIRLRLPDYIFEQLAPEERGAVAEAIARDPALQAELESLHAALGVLVDQLAPMTPSAHVRTRLLADVHGADRYGPFVARLASIAQLSIDKMRATLARIEEASFWDQGLPGIELAHFDAGPALAGADAGFIRMGADARFPRHRHLLGGEITFVLEGTLLDGDRVYRPGDIIEHPVDSVHVIAAGPEQPLLLMVVHRGIAPVFDP
jgi:hypothetical protein